MTKNRYIILEDFPIKSINVNQKNERLALVLDPSKEIEVSLPYIKTSNGQTGIEAVKDSNIILNENNSDVQFRLTTHTIEGHNFYLESTTIKNKIYWSIHRN
jgi:hypothetical protein